MVNIKKTSLYVSLAVVAGAVFVAGPVFAAPQSESTSNTPSSNYIALGAITAISDGQFTITEKASKDSTDQTIVTTGATTFKHNGQAASFDTLTVGSIVMAVGTPVTPDTLTASAVRIIAPIKK